MQAACVYSWHNKQRLDRRKIDMTSLCLLHGWATNSQIFNPLPPHLPADWTIHAPDLAGHGRSTAPLSLDIATLAHDIASSLQPNTHLFGWSLGGVVAQYIAAHYPHKIASLTLCATFAKFAASEDYPIGIQHNLLHRMLHLFEDDYPKHLQQFLELQLLHTPERNELIAELLPDMLRDGTPQGMASALQAIEAADMRPLLSQITCPTLLIFGDKDALTPPRMGEFLAQNLPHAQLVCIKQAAHAPFISHAAEVAQWLQRHIVAVERLI